MKVTLSHCDTYITISDNDASYSPDLLDDMTRRAVDTLTTTILALGMAHTTVVAEQDETGE